MRRLSLSLWLLAALFIIFIYLQGLGRYGFIDPDEGRYAEIPREMLESGDFVTPKLNYVKYFEKPVLHYWLTAGAFFLFGQNEFAGRLTPALLGLGGCLLTFWLARRMTGSSKAAGFSALILATSTLWYALSRLNITDMTLTFFFTLALLGYRLWLEDKQGRRRWLLLFYAGMALATLSKGLIGIVLPGGIAVVHLAVMRRWRDLLRLFAPSGIALYFLITVPWFWTVCRTNPDFFNFFFIHEHFLRYLTTEHDRYEPFWFFIPILAAAFVPWTGLLWDALRSVRGSGTLSRGDGLLLGLWFGMPFFFFSCSSSKLIPYILPCMPPLAVLMGSSLDSMGRPEPGQSRQYRRFMILGGLILLPLALTGLAWPYLSPRADIRDVAGPAMRLSAGLLAFWGASFLLRPKLVRRFAWHSLLLVMLAAVILFALSPAFDLVARRSSRRGIAEVTEQFLKDSNLKKDDVQVVVYRDIMQGVPFYLRRRVVVADADNELAFGAAQEKDPQWFLNGEQLKALWDGPRKVLLIARRRSIEALKKALGREPVQTGESVENVLFRNF